MVSAITALAVVVAALCAPLSSAFYLEDSPAELVPSTQRVSADQAYAKRWVVRGHNPFSITALELRVPGRVFIKYVENTTSEEGASGGNVFGLIKVSGTSKRAVELFEPSSKMSAIYTDETIRFKMLREPLSTDALLIEVDLLRKNALKSLSKSGTSDVVIEENVLYSADKDPFLNRIAYRSRDTVELRTVEGSGNIYVTDKTASLSMNALNLLSFGGHIQVELAGLKLNRTAQLLAGGPDNATLLVKNIAADIDIMDRSSGTGKVCIAADNTPKVAFPAGGDESFASYPGKKTGKFPCTTLKVPAREPVSLSSAQKSGGSATDSATTTTGPGTVKPGSDAAVTAPAKDSAGTVLGAATGLVLAAVLAIQAVM